MATLVTRSGKGSPLTHAEVDANFTNLNTDKLELSGGTMTGNLSFGDNDKAIFGAGSDLQIYHDGSNSYISDTAVGDLKLTSNGTNITFEKADGTDIFNVATSGATTAYYNGNAKLATTSTGIDVTGNATFADNGKAIFGAGSDLQIYHDGSNSYVDEQGTGNLFIRGTNHVYLQNSAGTKTYFAGNDPSGWVRLYHDNNKKFETTSTGIDVTGTITATDLILDSGTSSSVFLQDSTATNGYQLRANVSSSVDGGLLVEDLSGANIARFDSGGDISFYEDTGTTAKFFWDASAESLGIGTTSVSYPLDVRKNSTTNYVSSSTSQAQPYVNGDSVISLTNATATTNRGAFYSMGSTDAWGVTNLKYLGVVSQTGSYGGNFVIGGRTGSTSYSEHFRIDSTGNVGIGTTSPSAILHTRSTTPVLTADGSAFSSSSNGTGFGIYRSAAGRTAGYTWKIENAIRSGGSSASDYQIDDLLFKARASITDTTLTEHMRITSLGNVGIGTSSPTKSLHVYHATTNRPALVESGDADALIEFKDNSTSNAPAVGATGDNLIIQTGSSASERMRIDSSGNVGIGTSSPSTPLHIKDSNGGIIQTIEAGDSSNAYTKYINSTTGSGAFTDGFLVGLDTDESATFWLYEADHMKFATNNTERMRIDSSGNLLVGTTTDPATLTSTSTVSGIGFNGASGYGVFVRNGSVPLYANRRGTDGDIISIRKDGSTVGSIGANGSNIYIAGSATYPTGIRFYNAGMNPCDSTGAYVDNARDVGASNVRWDDIYATNGTIQTSDANEKQDIEVLSDAEQRVAVAAKGLLRKFRWKDAVAEKGDEARTHFGIIAQDLQAAFAAEGLDAGDYAMFIHSTWTDEETGEERSRMGVRYSELLAFIIAAI